MIQTFSCRDYYRIKRNKFFATIQKCHDLWEFFCKVDEIWKQELSDLVVAQDPDRSLPLALYINAHAKIRVSIELAFSQCMQEARSVLRDAVECGAHAHHMLRDPANLRAWQEKNQPDRKPSTPLSYRISGKCSFEVSKTCTTSTASVQKRDRTLPGCLSPTV
jgi:hypothetical protein